MHFQCPLVSFERDICWPRNSLVNLEPIMLLFAERINVVVCEIGEGCGRSIDLLLSHPQSRRNEPVHYLLEVRQHKSLPCFEITHTNPLQHSAAIMY